MVVEFQCVHLFSWWMLGMGQVGRKLMVVHREAWVSWPIFEAGRAFPGHWQVLSSPRSGYE